MNQYERIARMIDPHSIVNPDGSVSGIDRTPQSWWTNNPPGFQVISTADFAEAWQNYCSATVGRDQYDGSSGQVTNSPHSVTGLARGAGEGSSCPADASTPARASGEAADHG